VFRPFYDALYRTNVETDLIDPSTKELSRYKLIVVPALYSASDEEIAQLKAYVHEGGHLVLSFKSGFSDANLKVRSTPQPGGLAEAVGTTYSQFAIPEKVDLRGEPFGIDQKGEAVRWWMGFSSQRRRLSSPATIIQCGAATQRSHETAVSAEIKWVLPHFR
jgi:beta-galactosidase